MLKNALARSLVNDLNTLPRQNNAVVPICPKGVSGSPACDRPGDNLSLNCHNSGLRELAQSLYVVCERLYRGTPTRSSQVEVSVGAVLRGLQSAGRCKECSIAFKDRHMGFVALLHRQEV